MADLGDISGLLKEGSIVNLDWLDVDDKAYRDLDTLPKQNLDIAPDLMALWSHEGLAPSVYLEPNTAGKPRALADLSEAHQKNASEVIEQIRKVARLALMQSTDAARFRHALTSRFDLGSLRTAKEVIATVFQERGLLGKLYVEASDFADCSKGSKSVSDFTRKYAHEATFVVAKDSCAGCIHNSGDTCAVFHKQIVLNVPYSPELAERVEESQRAKGKLLQASSLIPRERIKAALLAGDVVVPGDTPSQKPIVNPAQYVKAPKTPGKVHLPVLSGWQAKMAQAEMEFGRTEGDLHKIAAAKKARAIISTLSREMLRGRGERELLQALKLTFSASELQDTKHIWTPLFKEAGYYGTLYSTQQSFDDCREGADFIAKHNPDIKAIVAGDKCSGCFYNKLNRCLIYGKPVVATDEELFTFETVATVLREHRLAGRLETGADKVQWGVTPKEALKEIYRVASTPKGGPQLPQRMRIEKAFHRVLSQENMTPPERPEIKAASQYMNEGLYGPQLLAVLKRRFGSNKLVEVKDALKRVLAEQGLQGIYFIDPGAYEDYGRGCDEASRLHRTRLVPYVKMGDKCASCVHQTRPGYCSKLSKDLVKEPPYTNKLAQQQEILASGQATEVPFDQIVNSHKSILAEFQMQGPMQVDVDPEPQKGPNVAVHIGRAKIKV